MKAIFIVQIVFLAFYMLLCTNALSIQPPIGEILSKHLCPDPTIKSSHHSRNPSRAARSPSLSHMPNKIMAINLDKPKDSTHYYERCTFREDMGSKGKSPGRSINVRSINLNVQPWDFSTAEDNCSSFIKFKNWDNHEGGRYPVLCGRENFDQYLGPYGHPMILVYEWKNNGLSFPLFHSSLGPHHHQDRKEVDELNYMQIFFAVQNNNTSTCRVQQYRLDLLRSGCAASELVEPVCGEYNCGELESLYQSKMTIMRDGDNENDTVLLWKPKSDKYRVRTFLRQKFVPVVFLVVLVFAYRSYMKAGLRFQNSVHDDLADYNVRSIRLRRHYPSARPYTSRELAGLESSFWDFDVEDPPSYGTPTRSSTRSTRSTSHDHHQVNNAIPQVSSQPHNSRAPPRHKPIHDPPPPYESVCPPSYSEATKPC